MDEFLDSGESSYDFNIVVNSNCRGQLEELEQAIKNEFSRVLQGYAETRAIALSDVDTILHWLGFRGGVEELVSQQLDQLCDPEVLLSDDISIVELNDAQRREKVLYILLAKIGNIFDEKARILRYQEYIVQKLLKSTSLCARQLMEEIRAIEGKEFNTLTMGAALSKVLLVNAGVR